MCVWVGRGDSSGECGCVCGWGGGGDSSGECVCVCGWVGGIPVVSVGVCGWVGGWGGGDCGGECVTEEAAVVGCGRSKCIFFSEKHDGSWHGRVP